MVFKNPDALTFKVKFSIPTRNEGKPRTFSTGMRDKAAARDVERMVERFKSRRRWEPLEAVFDGMLTLAGVYDAEIAGTLDTLLREFRDTDLEPKVSEWARRANAKYVKQVRVFIPEGQRFPSSRFRRARISEFLAGLDVSDPTRNRYRAALSVFAKWLVEREVLETNPVRDVAMYAEHEPRMMWMPWTDAIRVADRAPEPYQTLFRLMAATGMEISAALRLTRQDVQLAEGTIAVRGTKTPWRNRVVRFETWAAYHLERLCKPLVGFAPLFPGITNDAALDQFRAAQKAAGVAGAHRLHDLRHTYAVNALKRGYTYQVVAHQLGHRDASMVVKVYGRFIPDANDYQATTATNSATSGKKPREVKRAK